MSSLYWIFYWYPEAGVLKKLSLAGLAKQRRLRNSWLRFGFASADYRGLGVYTIGRCTQPADFTEQYEIPVVSPCTLLSWAGLAVSIFWLKLPPLVYVDLLLNWKLAPLSHLYTVILPTNTPSTSVRIFELAFISVSDPVWVGDLGTEAKKEISMILSFLRSVRYKKILKLGQN